MVWNWNAPSASLGTPSEAATPGAWPKYQDEILLRNLKTRENALVEARDNNGNPTGYQASPEVRSTYLDHTARNFEKEADEALHAEFQDWLQGKHHANQPGNDLYTNEVGAPVRRHVMGELVGQPMDGWHHTQWGKRQLTHLDGVRDHLRKQAIKRDEAELQMNILAEYGPSNLKEAWMYFKHWVKKRPVKLSPASTTDYDHEIGTRSRGFNLPPDGDSWPNQMQVNRSDPPGPPPFNPDDDDDDPGDLMLFNNRVDDETPDNAPSSGPTYIPPPPAERRVALPATVQIENAVEDAGGAVERVAEDVVNVAAGAALGVAGDAVDLAEDVLSDYGSARDEEEEEQSSEVGAQVLPTLDDDASSEVGAQVLPTYGDDAYYALVDSYFSIDSGILVKAFDDWTAPTVGQVQMSDAGLKDFADRLFTSAEEYARQSHDLSKKTGIAYQEMQTKAVADMKRIVDDHIKRGTFGKDAGVQQQWSDALIREFMYRTDLDADGNVKPRPQGSDFVITPSMKLAHVTIGPPESVNIAGDKRAVPSRPTKADGPSDPLYSEPYADKKRRPNRPGERLDAYYERTPAQRLVDQGEYHFLQADPKTVRKESILRGIPSRFHRGTQPRTWHEQGKKRSGAEARTWKEPKQLFQMGYTAENTSKTGSATKLPRFGFADKGSDAAKGNAPYAFSRPTPTKMGYVSSPTAGSPSTVYKFGWDPKHPGE
tara:strand:- start:8978 stop:11113 length:2136 start_codon:yes stop_codon:yes gene_type:complete